MKLQALLAGLFCAGAALATVNTTMNDDGTIRSVVYFAGPLAKRGCNSNNCLRAFKARASSATDFCHTFTASLATAVAPFT